MHRKLLVVVAVTALLADCGPGNMGTGGSAGGATAGGAAAGGTATAGGATAGGATAGGATAGGATAGGATAGGATAGGATAGGATAGGATAGGATAGGATAGGATAGGATAGGATAGGATAGGATAGGATAGGATAGGATAGGATAGGATAGGGTAGGGMPMPCDVINAPQCPAGEVCMLTNVQTFSASCLAGCDVVAQNCAFTEKCTYALAGTTVIRKCVPAGTVAEGLPCTSNMVNTDDCQRGLVCLSQGGSQRCTQFCSLLAPSACSNGGYCAAAINANMQEFATICTAPCSLLTPGSCPGGLTCIPISPPATTCVQAGFVSPGGNCMQVTDCVAGSACNPATFICERLCNLDGGSPACTAPATCQGAGFPQGAGACR